MTTVILPGDVFRQRAEDGSTAIFTVEAGVVIRDGEVSVPIRWFTGGFQELVTIEAFIRHIAAGTLVLIERPK